MQFHSAKKQKNIPIPIGRNRIDRRRSKPKCRSSTLRVVESQRQLVFWSRAKIRWISTVRSHCKRAFGGKPFFILFFYIFILFLSGSSFVWAVLSSFKVRNGETVYLIVYTYNSGAV